MNRYDPKHAPNAEEWLGLDEADRLDLAIRYHRALRIGVPDLIAHAAIHTAVETQLAMPDQHVVHATMRRLLDQGLPRHEAIHAIGAVLAEHMSELLRAVELPPNPTAKYYARLEQFTVEQWHRDFGEQSDS